MFNATHEVCYNCPCLLYWYVQKMKFTQLKSSNIEYVKIIYIDEFNEKLEIKTSLVSTNLKETILRYTGDEKILGTCPQYVLVKFVTSEAMYVVSTQLVEIVNHGKNSDMYIVTPKEVERRQKREHYRIPIEVAVVITCFNDDDEEIKYLSKTIDLSAGGAKVTLLKSIENGKRVENIDFAKYKLIKTTIYLTPKIPVTFDAELVRYERRENSVYAFEYKNRNMSLVDAVERFVLKEQLARKNQK